jgi:Nucleotidyl transferase AbiEii toxin, Type IV TA system
MLHLSTVEPFTLELIKGLMAVKEFEHFRMVGGTALALQMGHRSSIDIDLFCFHTFDTNDLANLIRHLGSVTLIKKSKSINIFTINDVKVDFVNYQYPWVGELIT